MKELYSKIIILLVDILAIFLSIILGYILRIFLDSSFEDTLNHALGIYSTLPLLYITTIGMLAYENIYTKRYDFWHESRHIIKALILSFILIMAFLAMTQTIFGYSRTVIAFSFMFMVFLIPTFKYFTKRLLYSNGLWQRKAFVYGKDVYFKKEIFSNPHLGYVEASKEDAKTIFIDSYKEELDTLKNLIETEVQKNHEVVFIPLINEYDLTRSFIYNLSSRRRNLIVFNNRLKSKYRQFLHIIFNYLLALVLLPILLPIIMIIGILIKKESSGPVFFAHMRVGKKGKSIPTFKFRSMYEDAEERLELLLKSDSTLREEWETNFKLKNDPRVTKIGAFLRKTSLDELPQIFNVLKGEMNFVGPRPVIQQEIDQYYKEDAQYYYMVKPGITGLWQVSGRSDTDYEFRVATDKWYISNWSLWLDITILIKTIKTVLKREGAY